jgi:FlaG/FlaF family flagellin (archaellin)
VPTRLTGLLVIALLAAACMSGGGSSPGSTAASSAVPTAATLPASGTAKLPDGVVYTVAAPEQTLTLDNLTLRILGLQWRRSVTGAVAPPGTRLYGVFRVRLANTSPTEAGTVAATQIWLRNTLNHTFLASGSAEVPHQLIGATVAPGQSVTGMLVFPVPGRQQGGLLVYRFGDTPAKATHVGVARFS